MAVELRSIRDGEQRAFALAVGVPFLDPGNEEEVTHWAPHLEIGRTWVGEDRGRIVANCCVFSRDVTVPGPAGGHCPVVPFAAVSGVGVHPTHRRQGLLRTMMATMLDDARERGEAFAGLLSSESSIYARFGFGLAVSAAAFTIPVHRSAFRADLQPPPLRFDLLEADEASKVVPALHDRLRRRCAGQVSRDEPTWAGTFADPPSRRGGMSRWMFAVGDEGYVAYRGRERDWASGALGQVRVHHLYGADPEVEAALWRFVLDIDLIDEVVAYPRPVDDPIRYRLAEPRALATTRVDDFFWVRVLDTAATLTARRYHQEARLVLDVAAMDGEPDPAAGRWVIDAGPDGATCVPAGPADAVDLRMGLTELGALYLGGVSATTLQGAGRIDEERPGALAAADRLFTTVPGPYAATGF